MKRKYNDVLDKVDDQAYSRGQQFEPRKALSVVDWDTCYNVAEMCVFLDWYYTAYYPMHVGCITKWRLCQVCLTNSMDS